MVSLPLGRDEDETALAPGAAPDADVNRDRTEARSEPAEQAADQLAQLEVDLADIGFENVRAGRDGDTVVVEYENGVFGRAEEDGIGVVLGWLALSAPEDAGSFAVVLRRDRMAVLELSGPLPSLRAYFGATGPRGGPPLETALRLSWHPRERLASAVANPSALHSQLVLGPGLRTLVATDVGTQRKPLQYVLSIRPEAIVTLWPGAVVYARADVPVL